MLKEVKTELEKYRTDIVAIQEIKWWGSGVLDT
jgi:mRNA deadenylase 3'-5' endonuclease subunit Ccr4